jgi:tetratricopeptide (TPR) repeat protein
MKTALESDFAPAYYQLGVILAGIGRHADAVCEFRRALFLDRNLVEAEMGLAWALRNSNCREQADSHFSRVLKRLHQMQDGVVLSSLGMTVEAARRVVQQELSEEPQ